MDAKKDKTVNPNSLPEQVFHEKEVYQHPQPQDQGQPLNRKVKAGSPAHTAGQPKEKTSKSEGLNEATSQGDAGAFEGYEDHSK